MKRNSKPNLQAHTQPPKPKTNDELVKENQDLLRKCFYYESIIAKMPGHVFWKNKNGIFLGCNDQQAKTLGLASWHEVVGKTTYDMIWHDQPEEERRKQAMTIDQHDKNIIETETTQIIEEPLIQQDGSQAIFLSNKSPLYNEKGEVIGILGFAVDITAQKEAEELKHERETIKQQLATIETLTATIAHELRTPLSGISLASEGAKKYFPSLIEAYKLAKKANLPIKNIRPSQFEILSSIFDEIIDEVNQSNTVINMLLLNVEQLTFQSHDFQFCSISHCIEEALNRYSFQPSDKNLIQWENKNDFNFKGKELLTIHVLFNLIKNSLYYVKAAGKGDIHIWLEPGTSFNKLHFRDTGVGIHPDILPKIFDLFFTNTYHGTGIGLAFCKTVMQSYGGQIECQSKEGEFTEFILSFPTPITE